jgi:thioredoxin 1
MSKRKKPVVHAAAPATRPASPMRLWRIAVPLLLAIAVIVAFANKPARNPAPVASAPAPAPAPMSSHASQDSVPAEHAQAASATAARATGLPRLVDLGADSCIPCKAMAPILVELRAEYAGRMEVDFIDVWKNPGAGDPYRIYAIPTQIFFDANGKELTRHEGFLSKADILATWKRHGLDFTAPAAPPPGS